MVAAGRRPYHEQSDTGLMEPTPVKKGIHPEYRPVVFMDAAANFSFLTRSTNRATDG